MLLEQGKLYIGGNEVLGIPDFECDVSEVADKHMRDIFTITSSNDYVSFQVKFNIESFYKLIGLYDWICTNCPNRRVVHLMKYGRTRRIRYKNLTRALRIIGKVLEKGERR